MRDKAVERRSSRVFGAGYVPDAKENDWKVFSDAASATSLFNILYFSSFDGTSVYENRGSVGGTVARMPFKSERRMFDRVQQEVIGYLERRGRRGLSPKDCKDIRYRLVASAGMEADVVCRSTSSPDVERVVVQLPFHDSRVVLHTHVDEVQTLGVIVPLQGRVEALKRLVNNLIEVTRVGRLKVVLTVVYNKDHNTEAIAGVVEAARRSDNFEAQLILLNGDFSRSRALKIGVELAKSGAEVVFLCDVDMIVSREFLLRCLASPIQGRQVFFPMIFSQYNPNLEYPVMGRKVPSTPDLNPSDHHGHWYLWGFGMACLYKSDFLKIDGYDSLRKGWGGEDLSFAKRVLAMNYTITRSLDKGLFHVYHFKDCSQAGRGQRRHCLRNQARNEASRQTLGLWYFKQKHNASIWGVLGDEEMQVKDVKAAQGEEEGKEELTVEEGEEGAAAGTLEGTLALQVTLLITIVVNIVLCASTVLTRAWRCSCARPT